MHNDHNKKKSDIKEKTEKKENTKDKIETKEKIKNMKLKKNYKEKPKHNKKFNDKNNIIEELEIDKNFDFNKYNYIYSWKNEDYITEYTKKRESGNNIYLVCSKRGKDSKNCLGKAKFNRLTGKLTIYSKCTNKKGNHNGIDINIFTKLFNNNIFKNINMELYLYQKYYIECLFKNNKVNNYTECIQIFKEQFPKTEFSLKEDTVSKI